MDFISQLSIYELGRDLLNILEIIHEAGYVYNNLSPDSVIFGVEKNIRFKSYQHENCFSEFSCHLIDFNHVTPYKDPETGKHIKPG